MLEGRGAGGRVVVVGEEEEGGGRLVVGGGVEEGGGVVEKEWWRHFGGWNRGMALARGFVLIVAEVLIKFKARINRHDHLGKVRYAQYTRATNALNRLESNSCSPLQDFLLYNLP